MYYMTQHLAHTGAPGCYFILDCLFSYANEHAFMVASFLEAIEWVGRVSQLPSIGSKYVKKCNQSCKFKFFHIISAELFQFLVH